MPTAPVLQHVQDKSHQVKNLILVGEAYWAEQMLFHFRS